MLASLWHHRQLLLISTKREILSRYRGSMLGIVWSFFLPLLMLAVYTFVFSYVFKARWGTGSDSKTEFALLLFAGLIVFNVFAECVSRAPGLILSNPNYVKKVIFPLEILSVVSLLTALYHALISFVVWLIAYIVLFGVPHLTVLYVPIVLMPFLLFSLGLSWILAALGVFLRDIAQVVGVAVSMLMFLSPIFYPISALPQEYQPLLYLSPLTIVIEQTRAVLFWGEMPDFTILGVYYLVAICFVYLGFYVFQKTRKGFADVL